MQLSDIALSDPITVRVPVTTLEKLRADSVRESIPVAVLIRRCVVREYPAVDGNSRNPTEDVGNVQSGQEAPSA